MTDPRPEGDNTPDDAPSIKDALSAAARKAGIGQVTPGEMPTAASLLRAVGGVRGLVEAIAPGAIFLVVYTITNDVAPSVLIPVAVGVLFVIARAIARTTMTSAIAGLIGIAMNNGPAILPPFGGTTPT